MFPSYKSTEMFVDAPTVTINGGISPKTRVVVSLSGTGYSMSSAPATSSLLEVRGFAVGKVCDSCTLAVGRKPVLKSRASLNTRVCLVKRVTMTSSASDPSRPTVPPVRRIALPFGMDQSMHCYVDAPGEELVSSIWMPISL